MLRKSCLAIVFIFLSFCSSVAPAFAVENPLDKPNNKIGIHILFTTEVQDASLLVNTNGGDWGYITIPIQSTDRDLKKWQTFMNACKKSHIIPLVRLATDVNTTTGTWEKPRLTDIIDAATFLNQLDWPTKNRYVIVYNEVNRGDEWGGTVSPSEYASLLSFAVTVFKSKSSDFFIISSGMDNAAPNKGSLYMNEYEYMRQMNQAIPAIFYQIDGLASHSYPNPGFSQSPNSQNSMGVASFKYERQFVKETTGKDLPVFITETGWSSNSVDDGQKIHYYQDVFATIWNDPGIVAITPFLLEAQNAAFQQFSFLSGTHSATKQYTMLRNLPKVKGIPTLPVKVLAAEVTKKSIQAESTTTAIDQESFFSKMFTGMLKLFHS